MKSKMDATLNWCAAFSVCRKYRYTLWRRWSDDWRSNYAMFIGLNPSTADEVQDDPTIRRCVNFCKDWGYSGLLMTNLFAYRATKPKDMMAAEDPVGPLNDEVILLGAGCAKLIVAAWGASGSFKGRDSAVIKMAGNLHHLGLTKQGLPKHPLYLSKQTVPTLWSE